MDGEKGTKGTQAYWFADATIFATNTGTVKEEVNSNENRPRTGCVGAEEFH